MRARTAVAYSGPSGIMVAVGRRLRAPDDVPDPKLPRNPVTVHDNPPPLRSHLALARRKYRRRFRQGPSRRAFLFGGAAMVISAIALGQRRSRSPRTRMEGLDRPVRPPTADHDDARFQRQCVRCGLCGTVCENGCIRFFAADETDMGALTPYLDVRRRSCTLCMRCTQICPSGALRAVPDEPEAIASQVKMGVAQVERDLCLSYLGRVCGYCHDACPLPGRAIKLTPPGIPVIQEGCVGCGRCVEFCPQNPSALSLIPASMGVG